MENFKVGYDGTVRDASSNVLQFNYGDDGFDPVKIVRLTIPKICAPWDTFGMSHEDELAVVSEANGVETARRYLKKWSLEFNTTQVSCPVDVESLYERALILSGNNPTKLSLRTILYRCSGLVQDCDNELFRNYLTLFFQLKRMVLLKTDFFDWFCSSIQDSFTRNKIDPGEMVGTLSGQSISEPSTQTRRTVHPRILTTECVIENAFQPHI